MSQDNESNREKSWNPMILDHYLIILCFFEKFLKINRVRLPVLFHLTNGYDKKRSEGDLSKQECTDNGHDAGKPSDDGKTDEWTYLGNSGQTEPDSFYSIG